MERFTDRNNCYEAQLSRLGNLCASHRADLGQGQGHIQLEYFDVLKACAQLGSNSAAASDGIPPEVWRAVPMLRIMAENSQRQKSSKRKRTFQTTFAVK